MIKIYYGAKVHNHMTQLCGDPEEPTAAFEQELRVSMRSILRTRTRIDSDQVIFLWFPKVHLTGGAHVVVEIVFGDHAVDEIYSAIREVFRKTLYLPGGTITRFFLISPPGGIEQRPLEVFTRKPLGDFGAG